MSDRKRIKKDFSRSILEAESFTARFFIERKAGGTENPKVSLIIKFLNGGGEVRFFAESVEDLLYTFNALNMAMLEYKEDVDNELSAEFLRWARSEEKKNQKDEVVINKDICQN